MQTSSQRTSCSWTLCVFRTGSKWLILDRLVMCPRQCVPPTSSHAITGREPLSVISIFSRVWKLSVMLSVFFFFLSYLMELNCFIAYIPSVLKSCLSNVPIYWGGINHTAVASMWCLRVLAVYEAKRWPSMWDILC